MGASTDFRFTTPVNLALLYFYPLVMLKLQKEGCADNVIQRRLCDFSESAPENMEDLRNISNPFRMIIEGERSVSKNKKVLKIGGKAYEIDALPDSAKAKVLNLKMAQAEMKRLNARIAITKTAINVYRQALKSELSDKALH